MSDLYRFTDKASGEKKGLLRSEDALKEKNIDIHDALGAGIIENHSCTELKDIPLLKKSIKLFPEDKALQEELTKLEKAINAPFEKKLDEAVLGLLSSEETAKNYLDLGESEGIWYYGFNLQGKEAIITSDGRVLRNTKENWKGKETGENQIRELFDYDGYLGNIAPTITRAAIKEYYEGKSRIDKRQIYDQVKNKILYYMDIQPEAVAVEACWIIATHCYPLFYWFPHILFNAPSDSGKTKNAFILMQLSFRGFDIGASAGVTPAQIFRTLEGNRGTILIDEFERQERSETQQLVTQILNASASKDAYVIRAEQIDKKWKAWKFPIFCPKIVCNISGINPTSMSRFIGFQLWKTTNREKSKRKPYRENDKQTFIPIRDSISLLILQNWQEIKAVYANLELDLINRDEDNWLPVCAVAKWVGQDVFEEVLKYVAAYKDLRIESDDLTQTIFLTIYERVSEQPTYYACKEMAEWLVDDLSMCKSPASVIGRKLKSYHLKSVRRSNANVYLLDKKLLKDIIDRYFGGTDKDTQVPKDTQHTQDTQVTLKSGACGACEPSPEVEVVDSEPKIEPAEVVV